MTVRWSSHTFSEVGLGFNLCWSICSHLPVSAQLVQLRGDSVQILAKSSTIHTYHGATSSARAIWGGDNFFPFPPNVPEGKTNIQINKKPHSSYGSSWKLKVCPLSLLPNSSPTVKGETDPIEFPACGIFAWNSFSSSKSHQAWLLHFLWKKLFWLC